MSKVVTWTTVQSFLASKGAQKHSRTETAFIYYLPRTGEYAKVVRYGEGYVVTVHPDRASCGCG